MVGIIYTLLITVTIYLIIVSVMMIKKTNSLIPVVPIAVMYFWSLYGAWDWIPMKLSGGSNFYESLLFIVNIDEYYFLSLLNYSIFIVLFATYILVKIKRQKCTTNKVYVNNYYDVIDSLITNKLYNIILCVLLGMFAILSYRDISAAIAGQVSAYQLSRFNSAMGVSGSLVQFVGDTFLYLSIPLLFSNYHKRKIIVITMVIIYFIVNFLLGNRNILLCGMVIGIILYSEFYGLKNTFKLRNIVLGLCIFGSIQLISFVRGISIDAVLDGKVDINMLNVLSSASKSSEKYAAQISMYGVLKNDVPLTYGTSVEYLISTFIPQFVGLDRPPRIYDHYVTHTVYGKPDIGVTIHHATAWYLNFGFIGIVFGALLWGYVLMYMYKRRTRFVYFFGTIIFSSISIQMIRDGGIESYKGGLLLATIVPMLIVYCCINRKKNYA